MRLLRAAAAVALALALALGAAACKPSSLTPFTGERGPDLPEDNPNGNWAGVNSTGRQITFQVGSGSLTNLLMLHSSPGCLIRFESSKTAIISGDAFTLEVFFSDQGRLVLEGTFTSANTCSGSYFFEGRHSSTGPCPKAGGGSFVAAKSR